MLEQRNIIIVFGKRFEPCWRASVSLAWSSLTHSPTTLPSENTQTADIFKPLKWLKIYPTKSRKYHKNYKNKTNNRYAIFKFNFQKRADQKWAWRQDVSISANSCVLTQNVNYIYCAMISSTKLILYSHLKFNFTAHTEMIKNKAMRSIRLY